MPRPRVTNQMTTTQVARQLGMGISQVISWVERGALPPPSSIDKTGARYFDQDWRRKARKIVESQRGVP